MGEEIAKSEFSAADFARYQARLEEETALLTRWFDEARFADDAPVSGFELEAWLVDEQYLPAIIERYGATHIALSNRAWEPLYATEGSMELAGYEPAAVVERGGERIAIYRTGQPSGKVERVENWFNVNE